MGLSPNIGPSGLQVQESFLSQMRVAWIPSKYKESENMKLQAKQNRPLRDAFNEFKNNGTLISKREAYPFFCCVFVISKTNFLFGFVFILIYSLIIFQGFVFTHQNDRKFSVCVSFKFGLSLIFRIRRLFSHLLP